VLIDLQLCDGIFWLVAKKKEEKVFFNFFEDFKGGVDYV
jgi:hypothetical protein